MLDWNRIADHKTYLTERFDLLVLLEGSTRAPYVDTVGDPTIGIGFNLVYNLEPVLRIIVGRANWSDTLLARIEHEIDKSYAPGANASLIANLDRVMAAWHDNHDSDVPSQFRFANDAQVARALDALAPTYNGMIDDWIAGIPESEERAALFSMTWNAPSLLGPKLKAAIEAGNRAEAWYEIRYNSNGSEISGIANRRYVEAETFGLFDDRVRSSYAESLEAGRMLATHHDNILDYEAAHDPVSAGQIKGVAGIEAIGDEMAPAIGAVLARFGLPGMTPVEELLAASAALPDVEGDGTGHDSRSNDDDLILGDAARNLLSGGVGRDTLIGLKGADRLSGGQGADCFVFSATGDSATSRADTVTDFGTGADRIDLSEILAVGKLVFLATEGEAFSGDVAEINWLREGQKTIISVDADADGQADMTIWLSGRMALQANDFLL